MGKKKKAGTRVPVTVGVGTRVSSVTSQAPAAEPFRPHAFQTKQQLIAPPPEPRIFITPEAYGDQLAIAELSGSDEIGNLGTVTCLGGNQYFIDAIYFCPQSVHGATCELTEDGLAELMTELAMTDEGCDACARMHYWGHVHPGNGTSPSPQDEDQMSLFQHNDFFIRGIFGRHGRAEFTFFDYKNGVRWNDVPWQIHCPVTQEKREYWRQQMEGKVTKIQPSYAGVQRYQDRLTEDEEDFGFGYGDPLSLSGGRQVSKRRW